MVDINKRQMVMDFYSFASGKLYTILLLKEQQEIKNICTMLVRQVIHHLFSQDFWDTLVIKATAKALQYLIHEHKNVEYAFNTSYKLLKKEYEKKKKFNTDELQFFKSERFDGEVESHVKGIIISMPIPRAAKERGYTTYEEFKNEMGEN